MNINRFISPPVAPCLLQHGGSVAFVRLCSPSSGESYRGRFPLVVIALFVFMGFSCAKQGYPPGGPIDETPPFLVRSMPASLATGVSKHEPVVFEFSESMDTKSVEDNLFIVPIPSSWPKYEWKSRDKLLILHFAQPFRDNTTCIISIGTKARDQRNNQLEESIMLSFSTGDVIENGKIKGKIIPYTFDSENSEDITGIDVVAYRMNDLGSPPDPRNDVPDYLTQSGSDGIYEMIGLSNGMYRIFAIGDRDRDGFYSEGYDLIGIAPHDVSLAEADTVAFAPDIAISTRDTTVVQLVSITVPDRQRVELYFDRTIESVSVRIEFNGLDIIDWFLPGDKPGMISTATEIQENGRQYTVRELQVMDSDRNRYHPAGIIPYFSGTDRPDTTVLKVMEWHPRILSPGDEHIRVIFNRVIDFPENPDEILTSDSLIDMSILKTGSNRVELIPKQKWRENQNYRVLFDREKLKGIAGNSLTDPGSQLEFRVVSSDTLGFIQGLIEDYTGSSRSRYRLIFKNLDTGTSFINDLRLTINDSNKERSVSPGSRTGAARRDASQRADRQSQQWSTGPVLPGRYVCRVYKDDDEDGKLFRGSIVPFKFAEQAVAYPDTIAVVSRWTNEDNTIIFR